MPSDHVWYIFKLPLLPQLLNQEPPRPQQLLLPDFSMVPHLGHTEVAMVVETAGVYIWVLTQETEKNVMETDAMSG